MELLPKTAVLGLGLMGTEIALRLQAQGVAVTGWNRGAERSQAAAAAGLAVAADAATAIGAADLVLLVLSDAAAIEATLLAPPAAAALRGRLIVQMGTIGPEESRGLAARLDALGGRYLEAPVLGSLGEAREGRLIIMVGGDETLFAQCRPVLERLGAQPQRIGAVGQAAALKLALNQLIAGLTATFALSLGLVRAQGIDVDQFMALLRGSALYAQTFDKKLDKYLSHDYGAANFPLKHLLKDVRLFRQAAAPLGLDTALAGAIEAACIRGQDLGLGDQDYSAIYEALSRG
ncbi:NAD(P)-dependent oxidoreductase [uncultured Lamprocystis sp.]|jgi:3-hydroxyisobutyrate dehydrogenase|uniref:NAD(P)-dependent oxidoreductase n=1 Tax=uncultured Lamprocystis sp. TaxID=543132 RepID=UPI0025E388BD|nr:NAD(P)-dependent oxidoreductase [uncultured Lamprocystis sp.]